MTKDRRTNIKVSNISVPPQKCDLAVRAVTYALDEKHLSRCYQAIGSFQRASFQMYLPQVFSPRTIAPVMKPEWDDSCSILESPPVSCDTGRTDHGDLQNPQNLPSHGVTLVTRAFVQLKVHKVDTTGNLQLFLQLHEQCTCAVLYSEARYLQISAVRWSQVFTDQSWVRRHEFKDHPVESIFRYTQSCNLQLLVRLCRCSTCDLSTLTPPQALPGWQNIVQRHTVLLTGRQTGSDRTIVSDVPKNRAVPILWTGFCHSHCSGERQTST